MYTSDNDYNIHEGNLLLKIWAHPKATLQYILDHVPEKYMYLFFILAGFSRAIDRAIDGNRGEDLPALAIVIIALCVGGLFGMMMSYFYAWLMSTTGKWIDGDAEPHQFRTVIAWSSFPTICSLLLLPLMIATFGDNFFLEDIPLSTELDELIYVGYLSTELILGIWTIVIFVKGVSLIQGFGTWKAIGNIFLAGLMILLPILGIAFFFSMIFG